MSQQPSTIVQIHMPGADADQIDLAVKMGKSLNARVSTVGKIVQATFPDTSQAEHQVRDWLEIVAASQSGKVIEISWWRAMGGVL